MPHLLPRMEAHILNVFSMGAFVSVPGQEFYCASKAAVKLLTDGLHSDLKNTGIGLFVAFMGAIATEIILHSGATSPDIFRSKLKTTQELHMKRPPQPF